MNSNFSIDKFLSKKSNDFKSESKENNMANVKFK